MAGRGYAHDVRRERGPPNVGIGRGLMTPGQFSKERLGFQTHKLKEICPIEITQSKGSISDEKPSTLTTAQSLSPMHNRPDFLRKNSSTSFDDTNASSGSTNAYKDTAKNFTRNQIIYRDKVQLFALKGQSCSKKHDEDQTESKDENSHDSHVWSSIDEKNNKGHAVKICQDEFQKEVFKMRGELGALEKDENGGHTQLESSFVKEDHEDIADAEAEWKRFKLERQVNRILASGDQDSSATNIAMDIESVIKDRPISRIHSQYSELKIVLHLLLTKVKDLKLPLEHLAYIFHYVSAQFPKETEVHLLQLIEEAKSEFITVSVSDTILSKSAERFCQLLAILYTLDCNVKTGYYKIMSYSITTSVERWTYPDGIDVSLEGHQINIAETQAMAVQVLLKQIGGKDDFVRRRPEQVHDLVKMALRIKESVLNANLPRTVREIHFETMLYEGIKWIKSRQDTKVKEENTDCNSYDSHTEEIKKALLGEKEDLNLRTGPIAGLATICRTVIPTSIESTDESLVTEDTSEHLDKVLGNDVEIGTSAETEHESHTKGCDELDIPWNPYENIEHMLSSLGFEDELYRFSTNLIRDPVLNSDKEDIRQLLKEACFPAGLTFEIMTYVNEHGPFEIQKPPRALSLRRNLLPKGTMTSPVENRQQTNKGETTEKMETMPPELVERKITGNTHHPGSYLQRDVSDEYQTDEHITTGNGKLPVKQRPLKQIVELPSPNTQKSQESLPHARERESYKVSLGRKVVSSNNKPLGLGRGMLLKDAIDISTSSGKLYGDEHGNEQWTDTERLEEDGYSDEEYNDLEGVPSIYQSSTFSYGGGYGQDNIELQSNSEKFLSCEDRLTNCDSRVDAFKNPDWKLSSAASQPKKPPSRNPQSRHHQEFVGRGRGFQKRSKNFGAWDDHVQKPWKRSERTYERFDGIQEIARGKPSLRTQSRRYHNESNPSHASLNFGKQPGCFSCGSKEHVTTQCEEKGAFFF